MQCSSFVQLVYNIGHILGGRAVSSLKLETYQERKSKSENDQEREKAEKWKYESENGDEYSSRWA